MRISDWSSDVCSSDLAFGDHADIAAGAEAATFGMIDQHRLDREIAAPPIERRGHGKAHIGVERVQRLRPVEPDAANPAVDCGDDILRHRPCSRESRSPGPHTPRSKLGVPAFAGTRKSKPLIAASARGRRSCASPGWCLRGSNGRADHARSRSEEHTSELQSLMRISYAVFCLKKKKLHIQLNTP